MQICINKSVGLYRTQKIRFHCENDARQRGRKRLDERLMALKPEDRFSAPPKGWMRAIRDALGMTGAQFARRLENRPQSVEALEKSEANGSIQLKTLRRAAEALDCTLVYALVPNTSLEGAVSARAKSPSVNSAASPIR